MKRFKGIQKICILTLAAALAFGSFTLQSVCAEKFLLQGNDCELIYAEWQGTGTYNVYYKTLNDADYTPVDNQLVRNDGNGFNRVDIVGLKGDTEYEVKIVPVVNNTEDEENALLFNETTQSYDRSGYAFYNTNNMPGAYTKEGTPDSNAVIIYVDNSNKNTVSAGGMRGLSNILRNGSKFSTPLIIRVLGQIDIPSGVSTGMLSVQNFTKGITIEGIGTDARFYGWGLNVSGNSDMEFRNIKYSWNYEDALGFQNCTYTWVHDNDFTVGNQTPPTESDKSHGDGSCDIKKCDYLTVSYNHFNGTAKTCLIGSSASSRENTGNLTFHHNYFDGTEQRTPRLRWHNIHIYNNYYNNAGYDVDDGSAIGYGIAATCNTSIFAENNYFEGTYRPMITSSQGNGIDGLSDNDGGVIKAFGNVLVNCTGYLPGTDYFEAASKYQVLTAEDFTAVKGGWTYNNFDTGLDFYTEDYFLETAEEAKATVIAKAGILTETVISSLNSDAGSGTGSNNGGSNDNDDNDDSGSTGTGSGDEVQTIAAQYYFDFPSSGTVATSFGGENGSGTFFTASKTISCSSTSGTINIGNDVYSYDGVGGFANNSTITFTTTDKAVFTIVSTSGSTTARKMILTDSSGNEISVFYSGTSGSGAVQSIVIENADTYTLTNNGGGEAKLFFIGVDENNTSDTETTETTTESTTVDDNSSESTTEQIVEPTTDIGYVLGDVTGEGEIDAADAANVLQKVLNNSFRLDIEVILGSDFIKAADVTGDGALNADDAAAILQKTLNNSYKFPVEV